MQLTDLNELAAVVRSQCPDVNRALRTVALIPELVSGETDAFTSDDWEVFRDALETLRDRSPRLREAFEIARDGASGSYHSDRPKRFARDRVDSSATLPSSKARAPGWLTGLSSFLDSRSIRSTPRDSCRE